MPAAEFWPPHIEPPQDLRRLPPFHRARGRQTFSNPVVVRPCQRIVCICSIPCHCNRFPILQVVIQITPRGICSGCPPDVAHIPTFQTTAWALPISRPMVLTPQVVIRAITECPYLHLRRWPRIHFHHITNHSTLIITARFRRIFRVREFRAKVVKRTSRLRTSILRGNHTPHLRLDPDMALPNSPGHACSIGGSAVRGSTATILYTSMSHISR